ncbi:sensor histidine kinase [Agaribacterium sp. ZY112]|uniref:sensor histidine kinase n=1 Tax=Agaribacterium sp. ZY112 TaxID=3233574 RepID=UPI0035269DCF
MIFKWGITLVSFLFAGLSQADIVDPLNAEQWRLIQSNNELKLSSWPATRIRQLEQLQTQLLDDIAALPRHCPVISDNHLGYHSSVTMDGGEGKSKLHQIDFTLAEPQQVQSIALVPAFNPLRPYGGSYAFPKRFKVEAETVSGSGFEEIINWMQDDFPNPGAYPVFFNDIDKEIQRLRFTAVGASGAASEAHFALGELFIWAEDGQGGLLSLAAQKRKPLVSTSGTYNQSSKWHLNYLTDMVTSLGFPITERELDRKDLLIHPHSFESLPEAIELQIDLGERRSVGRIDLWPAKPSSNIMLPDFGFPGQVVVEVSDEPDFYSPQLLNPSSTGDEFGSLFSFRIHAEKFRYLRITMANLQQMSGRAIWGLGEVAIYHTNGELISGASINAKGIPAQYLAQLPQLLDGYSWGRRILPEREWIMGLAKRRPLDQKLQQVENELELAHSYWQWLLSRLIIASVVILFLVLITAVILFQRAQRQQLLLRQGERITRDLHDEVGSSLGSITLLADELVNNKDAVTAAEDLSDLSLMAREANASLREVVWVGNGNGIYLHELLQALFERADRVLRGVCIEKNLPNQCPEIKVSLAVKRHLTMFFKEVIHNCARHSNASKLSLTVDFDKECMCITVADNGCGFDPETIDKGWGLNNLRQRAEEINGTLKIDAQPGEGVSIELKLALLMLSRQQELSYKTSN